MADPMHFERNASVYTRARPPYPPALWHRVREFLTAGGRAVDLGAGTGQATGQLVDAGMRVTAIEPGPQLARELQARFPTAEVMVKTAEAAELPNAEFDVAVAATSVHWMDLDVVLPKLHRALVPGGHFLVWRNVFGDRAATTPFRERVAAIVAARGPQSPRKQDAADTGWWAHELAGGGYFTATHVDCFRWTVDLTDRQIHELFTTFSDWTASEVDEAAQAVCDLGGTVTEHYVTPLIILRSHPNSCTQTPAE